MAKLFLVGPGVDIVAEELGGAVLLLADELPDRTGMTHQGLYCSRCVLEERGRVARRLLRYDGEGVRDRGFAHFGARRASLAALLRRGGRGAGRHAERKGRGRRRMKRRRAGTQRGQRRRSERWTRERRPGKRGATVYKEGRGAREALRSIIRGQATASVPRWALRDGRGARSKPSRQTLLLTSTAKRRGLRGQKNVAMRRATQESTTGPLALEPFLKSVQPHRTLIGRLPEGAANRGPDLRLENRKAEAKNARRKRTRVREGRPPMESRMSMRVQRRAPSESFRIDGRARPGLRGQRETRAKKDQDWPYHQIEDLEDLFAPRVTEQREENRGRGRRHPPA
ncbi:hypothetical protein BV20DRAFT_980092 [Pilatotrama ljubarskyi]|nr:hypothetical protein BV20DRAFT_980092 [Pilatotrama ljubarskyi]